MDRRDFLRFFGAGAAVVPIVGGIPHSDAAATLIEPPKIEPYRPPKVEGASVQQMEALTNGKMHVTIEVTQQKPELSHMRFSGGSFVIWGDRGTIEITALPTSDSLPSGRWNTDFLPRHERPVEYEFTIHARYRRDPDNKTYKTGSATYDPRRRSPHGF